MPYRMRDKQGHPGHKKLPFLNVKVWWEISGKFILLTVLSRPHPGYVAAVQEAYNTNVFHPNSPEK